MTGQALSFIIPIIHSASAELTQLYIEKAVTQTNRPAVRFHVSFGDEEIYVIVSMIRAKHICALPIGRSVTYPGPSMGMASTSRYATELVLDFVRAYTIHPITKKSVRPDGKVTILAEDYCHAFNLLYPNVP